jgi:hypothetical protein
MLSQTVAVEGYLSVDWVLLFFGLCFIAAALIFGSRWRNIPPIDLSSEKFGTLRLPFAPLVVFIGLAFIGVGAYFRWLQAQSRAVQVNQLQIELHELTHELERFKNYEMNVQLDFHTSVDPAHLHTNLYILKPGDPSPRSIDQGILKSTPASNILSTTVPSLDPGDTIYFVTSESGSSQAHSWESERLVIPIAQLNMSAKQ